MKTQRSTLPLGIDFGRTRVRVALAERVGDGRPTLTAVAVRDTNGAAAAALVDAVRELGTRERRCVIGIESPDAILRSLTLPSMSRFERTKVARFEALRFIDYPPADAAISLVATGRSQWRLGIARRDALRRRRLAARQARLSIVAVDDTRLAVQRLAIDAEAVLDVSEDRTRIIVFGQPFPLVGEISTGANTFTEGIAQSLGIDPAAAEERKRTIGFAGAGDFVRDAWIDAVSAALSGLHAARDTPIRRIALIGNGSRIPGLPEALERMTGYGARCAELPADASATLPADVLRAAGPDWSIAYGLTLWGSTP